MEKFRRILLLFLLTVSLLGNWFLFRQLNGMEQVIAQKEQEKKTFLSQYDIIKRDLERERNNFALLRHPLNERIALQATTYAPDATALLYWNPSEKTLLIDANGLPEPVDGKKYQVWEKTEADKYSSLGLFNYQTDRDNLFQLRELTNKDNNIIVSLELATGSLQPDMKRVLVSR
ncbi:MAG: anti-sigma factor [Chitinophagales bacterium]